MSAQFYSVPTGVQNAVGRTHHHIPQSIFQHTMSHQSPTQQNEPQWLGMPQVPPMSIPWSIPSLQRPELVRFTGQRPLQSFQPLVHQKRKLDTTDLVSTQPTKQVITDEKMAQHFQGLYISSNALKTQDSCFSMSTATPLTTDSEINLPTTVDPDDNNDNVRLVISEEIKRMIQEPILPSSLLSKLERPSMALVLWEPPNKHLSVLSSLRNTLPPTSSLDDNDDSNNNNNVVEMAGANNNSNNNNNQGVPNLNQPTDVNIVDTNFEPMDF